MAADAQLLHWSYAAFGLYVAEYTFIPKRRSVEAKDRLREAVDSLVGSQQRNGQIVGEELTAWVDGTLRLFCYVYEADSLSPNHLTEFGRSTYEKVVMLCKSAPTYRMIDDRPLPKRKFNLKAAKALTLSTAFISIQTPIRSGKTGAVVPVYYLRLGDELLHSLYHWTQKYKAIDRLWIDSLELEIPVYKQMAVPHSELSERGRLLCEQLEEATGLPTYYRLERYWGRKQGEEDRVCPNCGRAWRNPYRKKNWGALAEYDFLCKSCRVISNRAVSFEDERHARIGEYHERSRSREKNLDE
jgi:predicted  nucleic acid-binding Zn ribbon protein